MRLPPAIINDATSGGITLPLKDETTVKPPVMMLNQAVLLLKKFFVALLTFYLLRVWEQLLT